MAKEKKEGEDLFAHEVSEEELLDESRYLLFRLGTELYGTPLLGVREIVEPQTFKPIPNTAKYFLGVINLRGQIVGVIDLRIRLNIEQTKSAEMALVVFDTAGGPLAALVDKVEAVAYIAEAEVERNPQITTEVPVDFLLGIGKHEGTLVTLIELKKLLSAQELMKIRTMRGGAK